MRTSLRATIATFLAVLIALPVGWCCPPAVVARVANASSKSVPAKSCCEHAARQKSQSPETPVQGCRCCKDSPRAKDNVTPQLDAALVTPPGFLQIDSDSPVSSDVAAGIVCPDGLRLHVLQCVWLC